MTTIDASKQTPALPRVRVPALRLAAVIFMVAVLALVPVIAHWANETFYIVIGTRILVFALAALGLNLVLGYGALVSFGHAMYIGVGAYSVGILSRHGFTDGYLHLATALTVGAVCATLIGAVCLRAGGVAFIMITLAFAQMFYFLAIGLKQYGGDEGLPIATRSNFHVFDLDNATVLYYAAFVALMLTVYGLHRLINARFGMVLRGCKSNERRMLALGFSTFLYKLVAYVLSALICVVAGVLLANLARFASPSYMAWSVSGELMVMVVLGGIGTLMGPIVGATVWLVLEEVFTSFRVALPWGLDAYVRDHWMGLFGVLVIVVAMVLKQGLYGIVLRGERGHA